jgi:hypothetical protein
LAKKKEPDRDQKETQQTLKGIDFEERIAAVIGLGERRGRVFQRLGVDEREVGRRKGNNPKTGKI